MPAARVAIMGELLAAGKLHAGPMTVNGRTAGDNVKGVEVDAAYRDVILPYGKPLKEKAGFLNLKGNLFDSAIMKTSVISEEFRKALP